MMKFLVKMVFQTHKVFQQRQKRDFCPTHDLVFFHQIVEMRSCIRNIIEPHSH